MCQQNKQAYLLFIIVIYTWFHYFHVAPIVKFPDYCDFRDQTPDKHKLEHMHKTIALTSTRPLSLVLYQQIYILHACDNNERVQRHNKCIRITYILNVHIMYHNWNQNLAIAFVRAKCDDRFDWCATTCLRANSRRWTKHLCSNMDV